MKKYNNIQSDSKGAGGARRILVSKIGIYNKVHTNTFCKSNKESDIVLS